MIEAIVISQFDKFMQGALGERINREMKEVAANILGVNTPPEAKRSITITLSIKPDKNRAAAKVTSTVTTKLAACEPLSVVVNIGANDDGELVIAEMKNVLGGQTNFFNEDTEPPANVMILPTQQKAVTEE